MVATLLATDPFYHSLTHLLTSLSHFHAFPPAPHRSVNPPFETPARNLRFTGESEVGNQEQKGVEMKRINFGTIVCAATLVASAAFGQDQPEPFSPVTGVTTAPGTATITTATRNDVAGSVILKVDGSRVVDMTGQPIGRIDNIVLSPVGCTEAAILTAANGRLIPIPWSLVRVTDMRAAGTTTMMPGANLVFTVNTDQARLAAAPSFARSQWPDMSSNNWMQTSTTFFGVGAAGVGATGTGGTTVTGGATNTATRFGTTATGGTNQSRFGTTATTVPTNSSTTVLPPNNTTVLPPTGRPNPGFNQPNTPPATPDVPPGTPNNQPAPRVPPTTPPPGVPPTTPPQQAPPPQVPPSNPTTP